MDNYKSGFFSVAPRRQRQVLAMIALAMYSISSSIMFGNYWYWIWWGFEKSSIFCLSHGIGIKRFHSINVYTIKLWSSISLERTVDSSVYALAFIISLMLIARRWWISAFSYCYYINNLGPDCIVDNYDNELAINDYLFYQDLIDSEFHTPFDLIPTIELKE